MLSRVAERLYWMARYIERAESTARLLNAHTSQVLDLPESVRPGWKQLIGIMGANQLFEERHESYDERSAVRFLVSDAANPGAIMSSLSAARENVRTTRDVLPSEAWEHANELYLYARDNAAQAIGRKNRFYCLKAIIARCQQIDGLLSGTMSHDAAHEFVQIGKSLERADMTSRIVDGAIFVLMPREKQAGDYDSLLWVSVLKSLSAYQMYRQHVRRRIEGEAVVDFLLKDLAFPRSVAHALRAGEASLQMLPHSAGPLRSLAELRTWLEATETRGLSMDQLHRLIDDIQAGLNAVHEQIFATWFQLDRLAAPEAPTRPGEGSAPARGASAQAQTA